ncbi:MAG: AmmeMemoRadiSam system protein A [Methylobacter sp.]|nr:AmmeMemoRadiSam system protein A [Methylobacter sp.]
MLLTKAHHKQMLDSAKSSIQHGLQTGKPLKVKLADFPKELIIERATFVTLSIHHQLRGCMGMVKPIRPLIEDITENAYSAAFKDPRFPVLETSELNHLKIHLSILTPAEPVLFVSEQDLLTQLQPGIDGLILEYGYRRGTFLPSVWESLPEAEQFLQHLKQKAGLAPGYWSDNIRVYRYRTEMIA